MGFRDVEMRKFNKELELRFQDRNLQKEAEQQKDVVTSTGANLEGGKQDLSQQKFGGQQFGKQEFGGQQFGKQEFLGGKEGFVSQQMGESLQQRLSMLQKQQQCVRDFCRGMKQGSKLMEKFCFCLLYRLHQCEFLLNKQSFKNDIENQRLMGILEKGIRDQILQDMMSSQMSNLGF